MILLSEAINKPLGLIIIIMVAFFIIRMRKKVETYGINNNGNRQMGNVGRSIMAVGDIYVAIQFAFFILFISLLIFLLMVMNKTPSKQKQKKNIE